MSAKHILVIDDNEDIAEIICVTAKSLHMTTTIAADVAGFLAALTPEIDLIVIDLKMPEMSGSELMDLLARRRSTAKIVLMSGVGRTALGQAERYGRSLGLTVVGSLPKPFRVGELIEMLNR